MHILFFFPIEVAYRNRMSQIYLSHRKACSISYKNTSPNNFGTEAQLMILLMMRQKKNRILALYKDLFTLKLHTSLVNAPPNLFGQIFVKLPASHCRFKGRASIQGGSWST